MENLLGGTMGRKGKPSLFGRSREKERAKPLKAQPLTGRDIVRRDEHFRIAPGHPGMGRR
jgi:hypothetical protein